MYVSPKEQELSLVVELLKSVSIDETLTKKDAAKAIGRDISGTTVMIEARKLLAEEHGVLFQTVRGVGWRRTTNSEAPQIGQHARGYIRRKSHRIVRALNGVLNHQNDVDDATKKRILGEQSIMGLLIEISKEKSVPKLSDTATRPMSYAEAARDFMSRNRVVSDEG